MPRRVTTLPDGLRENRAVERERAGVDVADVELELIFPAKRVAAVDLREAGDAGPHFVPPRLLRRVAVEILHQQRPRADQAHVASQDVHSSGSSSRLRAPQPDPSAVIRGHRAATPRSRLDRSVIVRNLTSMNSRPSRPGRPGTRTGRAQSQPNRDDGGEEHRRQATPGGPAIRRRRTRVCRSGDTSSLSSAAPDGTAAVPAVTRRRASTICE